MLIDGVAIVKELEQLAGVEIFVQTGSLRIAETPERAAEIASLVEMGKSIGFDIDHMPIDEVARRMPYMRTDDLIDACYCPTDGHLQPAELAAAYIKVGKRARRSIQNEHAGDGHSDRIAAAFAACERPMANIMRRSSSTPAGPGRISTPSWPKRCSRPPRSATTISRRGPIPTHPVDRLSPAVRDRELRIYTRPESGGLIVGIYDAEPDLHDMRKLPVDFDMSRMKAARDSIQVARLIEAANHRFPWIDERTPMTITTGIMTFTPDARPFCGKMPDIEGLFHCSGFSGHGIVQSPAIGLIMSQLILDGKSTYDVCVDRGRPLLRHAGLPRAGRHRGQVRRHGRQLLRQSGAARRPVAGARIRRR